MQLLKRIFAVDAAAAEAAVNGGDAVIAFVINAVGDLQYFTSADGATGGGGGGAGGDEAERKITIRFVENKFLEEKNYSLGSN